MKSKITRGTGVLFILVAILVVVSCQSDEQLEFNRYYTTGSQVYQTRCQNCHGSHGEGLQRLIPPLTDQSYLETNKTSLACAVKYGFKGKINISGRVFDGEMPANDLASIEVAEVLTYIANSFGNKLGTINSERVDRDLGKCK